MSADIPRPASELFELVKVVEFDIAVNEEPVPVRVEFFRAVSDETLFRCRLWSIDSYRLTPSLPRDASGRPTETADDEIMVERSWQLSEPGETFTAAADSDAALAMVLEDLTRSLDYPTPGAAGGGKVWSRSARIRLGCSSTPAVPRAGTIHGCQEH